jgi:hypothetical protein
LSLLGVENAPLDKVALFQLLIFLESKQTTVYIQRFNESTKEKQSLDFRNSTVLNIHESARNILVIWVLQFRQMGHSAWEERIAEAYVIFIITHVQLLEA